MTAYKIALSVTNDHRWQAFIGPTWAGYYSMHCCEKAHSTPKKAVSHGFKVIRGLILTDLENLDPGTSGHVALHGHSST
jgi:hypothetical protein